MKNSLPMKIINHSMFLTAALVLFLAEGVFASEPRTDNTMKISIGHAVFTAQLEENPTATAFLDLLPLTLTMSEFNGNEKLYRFPQAFPSEPSSPGRIANGDIMLYGSDTVVVFYKSFPTPYRYTRIGKIENPESLEIALGPGEVTVTFEEL